MTVTVAGAPEALPYGVVRLLGGLVFSLGLILVVVGGAELFTGNNLMVMAWAGGLISLRALLRAWIIVYIGNFIGALGTAGLVFLSGHMDAGKGIVGRTALAIAEGKVTIPFAEAIALGILCNVLVCLAVWLAMAGRSVVDKIVGVLFPVAAFVAAGFEHCVANMSFVPLGIFLNDGSADVGWSAFLIRNLIPVTLGNLVGGAGLVGMTYWLIYGRIGDGAAGKEGS